MTRAWTRSAAAAMGLALSAALLGAACGGTEIKEERGTAIEHGAMLFSSRTPSAAKDNVFTCATCHSASQADVILSGGVLGGVQLRPHYWGGAVLDLLDAINACRSAFMGDRSPWSVDDESAKAMYAYLKSLPEVAPAPVPFTIVRAIADVPPGDPERGRVVYERACLTCHGAAKSGEGRLAQNIPRLPQDTFAEHSPEKGYTPVEVRLVAIQKVRHGGFLGYGGVMPPYSTEVLDDPKLSDVLAYLGF